MTTTVCARCGREIRQRTWQVMVAGGVTLAAITRWVPVDTDDLMCRGIRNLGSGDNSGYCTPRAEVAR